MNSSSASQRLSSRLTLPLRFFYVAVVGLLLYGALAGIYSGSFSGVSPVLRVLLALALLGLSLMVLRWFSFVAVRLEGFDLIVRGLWREWRFPAAHVADVRTWDRAAFTSVRVTLREPVPGLGRRFRFLGCVFATVSGSEAELIETAGRFRARGA